MDVSQKILSDITVYMKYAKYIPELKRRENWNELVTRNKNMHINKFPQIKEEIENAYKLVYEKKILPSMRSLQFAGRPIELNNTRLYNCSFLPIDSFEAFSEIMFLLLSGSGVGYSVQNSHIEKLPPVTKPTKSKRYLIGDSIEGWADAVKILIKAYMKGKPMPIFDFGDIRHKGANLITAGGKAPGPEPLKDCLHNIQKILDRKENGEQLTSIEVHDICCYIADSVLAGGIRRCLPEGSLVHTKNGMINIEDIEVGDLVLTSNGYYPVKNKFDQGIQKLLRVHTQDSYFDCTSNHKIAVLSGQNEYIWKTADSLETGDRLIAPSIPIEGKDVNLPDFIYSKPLHSTTCKDIIIPELDTDISWLMGLIQGDGYVRLTSKSGYVSIACSKDFPQIIEKAHQQLRRFGVNTSQKDYDNYVVVSVKSKQLAVYFNSFLKQPKNLLKVPYFFWEAKKDIKLSFVSGLMDADGSVKTRPAQVCVSVYEDYCKEIRLLLSSCGVQTRLKKMSETNLKDNWQKKYSVVAINNKSKEELNKFGFKKIEIKHNEQRTNSYPKEFLDFPYPSNYPWSKTENKLIPVSVVEIEELEEEKQTWDIEVEEMHEFFCEGYLMHNSAMISLFDIDDEDMLTCKFGSWWDENPQRARANNTAVVVRHMVDEQSFFNLWKKIEASGSGEPGIFFTNDPSWGLNPCSEISLRPFQFCNLVTINSSDVESQEEYNERARSAAFIATLQASYTNFHYLRDIWKKTTEKEALIGVSMTGIASGNVLKLNMKEAANIVKQENVRVANIIGIKPSARTTTVKPEGTASLVLGSSSGIHAWHNNYYLRRIRVGKDEAIYNYLIENHPEIVEDEYFKPKQQAVITIPQKAPEGAITREESALDLLHRVEKVYKNWISQGHNKGVNKNNVSTTVTIKPNEWEEVGEWMWNNKEKFTALSVLPYNDHSYIQAPFEDCSKEEYETKLNILHNINLDDVREEQDHTNLTEQAACAGNGCEI